MTKVLHKTAVSKTSNKGGADVDAKALTGFDSQIGFYEAALLKAKLQAAAKSSRPDAHAVQEDEEEVSAVMTEAEAEAEAEAQVQALIDGAVVADPETVLLAANGAAASEPARAGAQPFTADNPLSYALPALLIGAVALGGGSSSAAATEDHCDIDFTFPNRPTGATVETISVAAIESEVQASGSPMELAAGDSLVVELGAHSNLSGETGDFLVTVSGNMGDLYIDVGDNANINMRVDVDGGVGNISMLTGNDTDSFNVTVIADGDVGQVTRLADGFNARGFLTVDTTGGDVAQVEVMYANPDGGDATNISAFAVASGSALVGGNVGDVRVIAEGIGSDGRVYVYASGGNVGDLESIACGGSASGQLHVSAYAQINGNGLAVGGNVGDLTLLADGTSADSQLSAFAYGVLSGGQYLGGGNIGDVLLRSEGYSAEANADLYSYSGGSIGNITLQVSSPGDESYETSAYVSASVYGAGGQVAAIGDVTMDIYGGMDNSGKVDLNAYTGGNIGSITATATGGGSGQFDIYASAYATVSGSGGNIGTVSLTDTSWGGDHDINLTADKSIGAMTLSVGAGSADLGMRVNAGGDAVVGNISVAFDADHYGSGSHLYLGLVSGATGADISVTGGSELSTYRIIANDIDYEEDVDSEKYYEFDVAQVVGNIDMSGFAGFADIDLTTVVEGVSIEVGQGGSYVIGTLGADTITLGAGSDEVDFDNFDFSALVAPTDSITGFDALADLADASDTMDALVMFAEENNFYELTSNDTTTLVDEDVITLVDLADGQDISTAVGLLAALNGGEYGSVDSMGGEFTFATATGTTATSFNLFRVEHDGTDFTDAYLLADVTMATGSTFEDLSANNFVYYV